MKRVFSTIVFLCLLSAQADVIIYKQNILVTERQDGFATTERHTGWTVIDLQTGQLGIVKAFGNWVSVEQPEAEMAALLGTPHRAKALGIISIKNGGFAGLTAKGINQSLPIGLSTDWTIPRTLAVGGLHLVYTNYSFPTFPPIFIPNPPIILLPVRTNPPGGAISIGLTSQTISGGIFTEISSRRQSVENYLSRVRIGVSADEVAPPNINNYSWWAPTNNFSLNRSVEQRLLREFKGALIYDRENTLQANTDHLDLNTTLLQFKQLLLNKGYYDWDNQAVLHIPTQEMQLRYQNVLMEIQHTLPSRPPLPPLPSLE